MLLQTSVRLYFNSGPKSEYFCSLRGKTGNLKMQVIWPEKTPFSGITFTAALLCNNCKCVYDILKTYVAPTGKK